MASTLPIPVPPQIDSTDARPAGEALAPASGDARWALIDRILQSKGFRKSQRPSDFLLYVCKKSLSGQTGHLTEQDIGEHVFTRKDGFDPGVDNIVRVTARRVRQKLEEYYTVEGQEESIVLSIPVGGYVPRFDPRHAVAFEPVAAPEPADTSVVPPSAPASIASADTKHHARPLSRIAAIAAAAAVALGIVGAWRYHSREAELDLPANVMWNSLLNAGSRSIFVPGDSALVLLENHTHHPVALNDYISKRYLANLPVDAQHPADIEREEAQRPYNSFVDVRFVAQLARLPEAVKPPDVVLPRDLSLEDLKQNDVILSGAREANPWVQMFQDSLDYLIVDRQQGNNYTVVNHHPANGEPAMYTYDSSDPAHIAYAIVIYMPNLSGKGHVLLLQGTTMAGTEAAMDFVLDRDRLNKFLASHTQHRRVQPFQVLLETTNINGSSPQSRILSYHFHN